MIAATFAMSLQEVGNGQTLTWAPATPVGNAASPAQTIAVALIDGTIEVAVPPGSIGFVYVPVVQIGVAAAQKTLKFASTDAGGPMSVALPTPYDWAGAASPPTNLWFTSNQAESGTLYFF
jgi:hypothetical protein